MIGLSICYVLGREACHVPRLSTLVRLLSLLCACVSQVHASVALQSIVLPQAMTRSVIVEKSHWQGAGVELEHLLSEATLEATLEQLATLLPALTPVWSEQGVTRAHWSTDQASYALFLWATETQGTEGLLSGLTLRQPHGLVPNTPVANTSSAHVNALAWLPGEAAQLFRFVDNTNGSSIVLTSFSVPLISSRVIDHVSRYGQRHGWLRLSDALTFVRDTKRLSFLLHPAQGSTTVLVYETSRDAP